MKNRKGINRSYPENLKEYLSRLVAEQIPYKNKSFQAKVKELRLKWSIPFSGFKFSSDEKDWWEKPPKEITKYPKNIKEKQREIISLGNEEEIVTEWVPKLVKGITLNKRYNNFPLGSFYSDIDIFLSENNIDLTLKALFINFLLHNKISDELLPKHIVEVSERLTITGKRKQTDRQISITFGPNVRQVDIAAVWKNQIEPLQKKLPGYFVKRLSKKRSFSKP